jgi:PEP-CTERM motif
MRHLLFTALVALCSALPVTPAGADVVFSTFGPGNSYECCVGGTIGGSTSGPGFISQANEFTSSGNFDVSQIDLGLAFVSGTNSAVVSLWTESGGLQDTELGSWNVSSLPDFGSTSNTVTSITGISGISLASGLNYFLQVDAGASDTWDAWNWNTIGATGLVVYDTGSGWASNNNATLYAFDVVSASVVPEPGTLALVGASVLGLAGLRRRRPRVRVATS